MKSLSASNSREHATNAQQLMSVRLSRRSPGVSVTLSSSTAWAGRAQQMLRQLGCATTASTNAHWSRTSCSSARHCTGDNQGSGLWMVLSKIGCPRRYSTSFGTFDLLFGILCTCTSYLCCIRMHEPVLVSMRRPRRYSKKCTCTWLTLVSQSLVVGWQWPKKKFSPVTSGCTLWKSSKVESRSVSIFWPNTPACNTQKWLTNCTVQFTVLVRQQKSKKKFTTGLLIVVLHFCPFLLV